MDRWAENQLVRFSSFIGKGRYAVDTENGYDEITGAENIFFQDKSFNLASDDKKQHLIR